MPDPIGLIGDDSESDGLTMSTVFEHAGFVEPLRFARDGVDADRGQSPCLELKKSSGG